MMMKGTDPSILNIWLESRTCGKGIEDDDDTMDLHMLLDGFSGCLLGVDVVVGFK